MKNYLMILFQITLRILFGLLKGKILLRIATDKTSPKEYLKSTNFVILNLKDWLDYFFGEGIYYKRELSDLLFSLL